jgi:beta-galactosidase
LRWGVGAAALNAALPVEWILSQSPRGAEQTVISLNQGWKFRAADAPASSAAAVTLPHTPVKLSWQDWDPDSWQRLWTYSRSFPQPLKASAKARIFLRFEGVMTGVQFLLNGRVLEEHRGGFLPFEREITSMLQAQNDLEVTVDGRWQNVPPGGTPKGPKEIDYLMPAGIHRDVTLRVLPELFLDDVFAKPVNVLGPDRHLAMQCTIDASRAGKGPVSIQATLLDGVKVAGTALTSVTVDRPGRTEVRFAMQGLEGVSLWSPESPKLYTLSLTLIEKDGARHKYTTRVGFREARFAVDGFYLNGKKTRIFGLNRHELFPYVGFAMPERVMRHDAELLRHQYNCNTVRCSHYPQTEAFLDACDELGLMVWEEVPGWQYIGDAAWQGSLMRDLRTMIVRDRNHPSIIIWGARVNESRNDVPLYTKTTALAKSLDDSRQMSGTMTQHSVKDWVEDVFAYDDYHAAADGSVAMYDALPDVPYFFAEAVGQFAYEHGGGFKQYYRRAGARNVEEGQARYHAQGHDRAARDPRCAGVIAWCAIDYASQLNGYRALKCPGVTDTFRIPKLGATFYKSQVSPSVRPVIEPNFYWGFAEGGGPGSKATIFSNCDRLVVTAGAQPPITVNPDKAGYPNLRYAPFVVDLSAANHGGEDLVVEGFVAGKSVLRRQFSSDRSYDKLTLQCDDLSIRGDGTDATRVWFAVCDRYGTIVKHLEGSVAVSIDGPGELIGDSLFALSETGGVGAVWVRSRPGSSGKITVAVEHPRFGSNKVSVNVERTA